VPSQTFSHSAVAASPQDAVWKALDTPETWEGIPGVDRVFDPIIDDDARLRGFSFESTAGGRRHLGTALPEERVEGEVMAWRIETSEVHGGIRVELAPSPRGTAIEITLRVASAGIMSSMFFPVIAAAIGSGLPRAVDEFAAGLSSRA
jgi:carbon monoxide dehydrogenase subunit G